MKIVEAQTLHRKESIHEQREVISNNLSLKKGMWIEEVDFDRKTEHVKIKSRLEVKKIRFKPYKAKNGRKRERLFIHCKKHDVKAANKEAAGIADKIIGKHNEILKASLVKCFIDGINTSSPYEIRKMMRSFEKSIGGLKNGKENT